MRCAGGTSLRPPYIKRFVNYKGDPLILSATYGLDLTPRVLYVSQMALSDQLLLRRMNEDRSVAAAMLFPHRHRHQSPEFHVKLTDCWRSANEFVVVEAFREGAKTTLSEEFLLIEALFANFKYCLIFGETYTKACQRIESMKHELMTNRGILASFGGTANSLKGKVWSENKIVLPNGVCVEAHGWEEEIRGYLHFDARPDRVYLDDIETEELVRDSGTVDKQWRKLHKQLIPAIDKELGKVRMTGTPLGRRLYDPARRGIQAVAQCAVPHLRPGYR